eukprot:445036_1
MAFQQIQEYKQAQTQEMKVIKTQLLLDQLDNCLAALDMLRQQAKTNKDKSDLASFCSMAVSQVNLFGSSCKRQNKKGNTRALHLASYKLSEYCSKINGQKDRMILNSYVQYLQCVVNGVKVKTIPGIKTKEEDWNDEVGNSFFGNYLGAQHTIDDKITTYKSQQKILEKQMEAQWKQNNRKLIEVIQNPKQVSPEQYYVVAGITLNDLDIKFKKSENMSLKGHKEVFGGYDKSNKKAKGSDVQMKGNW